MAAEELQLPPIRSPRSTVGRDQEHKAQSHKPGSSGYPGLSGGAGSGDRALGQCRDKGKTGWASLPQLFHSPGNWPMFGVTPGLNSDHLPITPYPFPQPDYFSGPSLNLSESLQGSAELWPQEKAIPILPWPCASTNNPSLTPKYTLPIHQHGRGDCTGILWAKEE